MLYPERDLLLILKQQAQKRNTEAREPGGIETKNIPKKKQRNDRIHN
jgi:hypothetical protein